MNFRKIHTAHRRRILSAILRLLVVVETATNRLRGLLFRDRRTPVHYHEIGDRRITPPIRARHLVAPAVALQGLVLLYALTQGPQVVFLAGIGTFIVVGLVMLPTMLRKA
jgi:hypothetical protein